MQFSIDKDIFLKAITVANGAVNPRATIPVLSNLLIESIGSDGLRVTGTDLEFGIQTHCEANVDEEGVATIPAKKIHDIIRELAGGKVQITVGKNFAVNIKTEKSFFKIMGVGAEDFPKFPEPKADQTLTLNQSDLKQCLSLTLFAISRDEARYTLNGVLIIASENMLRFVATDGKRLACVEHKSKLDKKNGLEVIVPAKTVSELLKALVDENGDVEMVRAQNQIFFKVGGTTIVSRLIEGRFPNYEQVIPKGESTKTQIARQELLSAIKRVSLLTSQDNQSVKLDFLKGGKLMISSRSPNMGEAKEEVEAVVSGDDLTIGFNPTYLIDVLKNLDVDRISISLTSPDKPGVIKDDNGYQYVVMPMQLT